MKTLQEMENQAKAIKLDLMKICWYMRGGVTYDEANALCPQERNLVAALVKDNLETTKKTGQPFF
tara:strand:+ start:488 stop:682 length:195 start_codon:yes stop_codon:yes gene_type:complete